MATSSSVVIPCWPVASASATHCSASFRECDFAHDAHFPTTFMPRSQHSAVYLSQTDFLSCRTALTPFGCLLNFESGWSSGKIICWIWPHVSSSPGAGSGLLSGITVLCSFLCFPPGLTFILLMLSAFSAKPSCAEDRSNVKIAVQLGCVCSKTLIAILI